MTGRGAVATLLTLALCGVAWWLGLWLSERLSLGALGLLVPLDTTFAALGAAERPLGRLAPSRQEGDRPHDCIAAGTALSEGVQGGNRGPPLGSAIRGRPAFVRDRVSEVPVAARRHIH